MNLVYIHGLDSDSNSTKGQLLEAYCQQHCPNIRVYRPDLNQVPTVVVNKLIDLVSQLPKKTVLIGSSLGGYFATLVSNHTGCPALLLNPSTQPHISLQRFAEANELKSNSDQVIYTTSGGWQMTVADLRWFDEHQLTAVTYPDRIAVFIKQGDELLDARIAARFYQDQGAQVVMQDGGDHRFSDFQEQLPQVLQVIKAL